MIVALAMPGTAPLKFKAEQPTQIEAVFNNDVHSVGGVAASTSPAISQPAARLMWRTIPAGESWMGCVPGDERCDEAHELAEDARANRIDHAQRPFAQPSGRALHQGGSDRSEDDPEPPASGVRMAR